MWVVIVNNYKKYTLNVGKWNWCCSKCAVIFSATPQQGIAMTECILRGREQVFGAFVLFSENIFKCCQLHTRSSKLSRLGAVWTSVSVISRATPWVRIGAIIEWRCWGPGRSVLVVSYTWSSKIPRQTLCSAATVKHVCVLQPIC